MSIALTVEERLAALEKEVRELKQGQKSAPGKANWINQVAGSFKDDPDFGEILKLGQEIRRKAGVQDDDGDA